MIDSDVNRIAICYLGRSFAALIVWVSIRPTITIDSALSAAERTVVDLAIDTHLQLLALSPIHISACVLTRALEWIDVN
jgi:hypothetical protein